VLAVAAAPRSHCASHLPERDIREVKKPSEDWEVGKPGNPLNGIFVAVSQCEEVEEEVCLNFRPDRDRALASPESAAYRPIEQPELNPVNDQAAARGEPLVRSEFQ
jgi:hypothetical protein